MQKKLVWSSLILSQALSPLAPAALAAQRPSYSVNSSSSDRDLVLAAKDITFQSKTARLVVALNQESLTGKDSATNIEKLFNFSGSVYILVGGEQIVLGADDSDGNMVFEEIESKDPKHKRYRGYSCSSSFTGCEAQDGTTDDNGTAGIFELDYNTEAKIWSVNIKTKIDQGRSHEGVDFVLNTVLGPQ